MAINTGTLILKDLLRERFQSVAEFGVNTVLDVIQRDQDAYNRQLQGMFDLLADQTGDRQRISGASGAGDMVDVDETGTAPTQKAGQGAAVGFPMRAKQWNLGWTYRWFQSHTPAEMAEQTLNGQQAHMRGLIRDMKRAVYTATNSTFTDTLMAPRLPLAVKAFQNADGFPIPNGPNGETFVAATHQHYTAAASLAAADIVSSVNTVVEHGFGTRPIIAINVADVTAFSALTGFVGAQPVTIVPSVNADRAAMELDATRVNDRFIGIFNKTAQVWSKPWAIANYAFTFDAGSPLKPLALRTRRGEAPVLDAVAESELHPLHAKYYETEYGFGVWNRLNGAVHQFNNGTYVSPTIT